MFGAWWAEGVERLKWQIKKTKFTEKGKFLGRRAGSEAHIAYPLMVGQNAARLGTISRKSNPEYQKPEKAREEIRV